MTRFKLDIHGQGLDQAMIALNAASIPTIGPTFTGRAGMPLELVGKTMHAILHASTPESAQARVREALPADGDFDVADAQPFPPEQE
jgi:hypothetical protein